MLKIIFTLAILHTGIANAEEIQCSYFYNNSTDSLCVRDSVHYTATYVNLEHAKHNLMLAQQDNDCRVGNTSLISIEALTLSYTCRDSDNKSIDPLTSR